MFLGIDHLVISVADPDDAAAQVDGELGLAARRAVLFRSIRPRKKRP